VAIEKSPSLFQQAQQGDFSIENHTRIIKLLVHRSKRRRQAGVW